MTKKLNLSEKNDAQLQEELAKQREDLRTLRFAAAGSRPKDSTEPRKVRAAIARIMTEKHARKLNVEESEVETPAEAVETTA